MPMNKVLEVTADVSKMPDVCKYNYKLYTEISMKLLQNNTLHYMHKYSIRIVDSTSI